MATAFMFKGPAALTSGSTVTAAGASTFDETVEITGVATLTGGFTLDGATITLIEKIAGPGDDTLVTKGYADATYGGGGGGTAPSVESVTGTDTDVPLVDNRTYFIRNMGGDVTITLTQTSLADGSVVRLVCDAFSATNDLFVNLGTGLGGGIQAVGSGGTGGTGNTMTFSAVGQSVSLVYNANKLHVIAGAVELTTVA